MKKYLILILLISCGLLYSISLKEVFDSAQPQGEFQKYIVLETGVTYTGGLLIGKTLNPITHLLQGNEGQDVKIIGNGAILDLQGSQICISYCDNKLEIEDCVILNGNIRFRGINSETDVQIPTGYVKHVTFYKPHDYAIRLQGAGGGILLERNLAVNAVDTGFDYLFINGTANSWLPTGINFAPSIQVGFYGTPEIKENWSYFSKETENENPLKHFTAL